MHDDIQRRMNAIRLPIKAVAALSGVHRETVYRMLRGEQKRGAMYLTQKAIESVITAEEIRLRDYLVALHGIPHGE